MGNPAFTIRTHQFSRREVMAASRYFEHVTRPVDALRLAALDAGDALARLATDPARRMVQSESASAGAALVVDLFETDVPGLFAEIFRWKTLGESNFADLNTILTTAWNCDVFIGIRQDHDGNRPVIRCTFPFQPPRWPAQVPSPSILAH